MSYQFVVVEPLAMARPFVGTAAIAHVLYEDWREVYICVREDLSNFHAYDVVSGEYLGYAWEFAELREVTDKLRVYLPQLLAKAVAEASVQPSLRVVA